MKIMFKLMRPLIVLLTLTGLTFAGLVKADDQLGSGHSQSFTIVKYGLKPNSTSFGSESNNTGEKINNIPVDDQGNKLQPLAGVSYIIQKVTPTSDPAKLSAKDPTAYQLEGQAVTLITDAEGLAKTNLVDGYYIVSEQAAPSLGLTSPAVPVLYRLPVLNPTKDGYLSEVYMYPKSSIDRGENTPPTTPPTTPSQPNKPNHILPRTGEATSLLVLAGSIMLALVVLVVVKRQKMKKGEVE